MEESKLVEIKPERISNSSALKGCDEEPTNSSKMDSITLDLDESLNDSFFGSISEGDDAGLIQKIPQMNCTLNPHNNQKSPGTVNLLLLASVEDNNAADLIDIITKSSTKPDPNFKWEDDNTFLHIAASNGHLRVCEALLDYLENIQLNARNKNLMQPLHLAALKGHLQVAQLLVRSGAELNPIDNEGNTPLHLATKGKYLELVSWLLSRGPNIHIINDEGLTPEELANEEILPFYKRFIRKTLVSGGPSITETQKLQALRAKAIENTKELSADQFVVLKQIGKGSFGEVFLVRKTDTSVLYAMKVLEKDKIIGQNLILYALTERNVLSQMHHPFIVSLLFAFQTTEKLFLILDYCPGGDLASHLKLEKKFSESRARIYICEIILAIEELHNHDIIFRDLKPDNIVLDSEGHAVLTDFGLSKVGIDSNYKAKSFCGSIAYLAPEVLRRNGHGKAVDWYLLGVVLYEMVVGLPPYFSINKGELLNNIQKGKLKIPTNLSIEVKELIKEVKTI